MKISKTNKSGNAGEHNLQSCSTLGNKCRAVGLLTICGYPRPPVFWFTGPEVAA